MEQFIPMLINVLEVFLIGVAGAASAWIGNKFRSKKLSDNLEKILTDSIDVMLDKARKDVENPNTTTTKINAKKDLVGKSMEDIKANNSKAIKKMKISDDEIEEKLKKLLIKHPDLNEVKHLIEDLYEI